MAAAGLHRQTCCCDYVCAVTTCLCCWQKKITVTLRSGEEALVLLGDEEEQIAASGLRFRVQWGTDEHGNLIPFDTVERNAAHEAAAPQTIPQYRDKTADAVPNDSVNGLNNSETTGTNMPVSDEETNASVVDIVKVQNGEVVENIVIQKTPEIVEVQNGKVADNVAVGKAFPESAEVSTSQYSSRGSELIRRRGRSEWTREEVRTRVDELNTSFARRTEALMRKNVAFQGTRRVTPPCGI